MLNKTTNSKLDSIKNCLILSLSKYFDYYSIKESLLYRSEYQIFNGDDRYLHQTGLHQWADAYWTTVKGKDNLLCDSNKGVYIQDNWIVAFGELIAPLNIFKMPGYHNQQNLLMAMPH